jgi:hypothetical protein
MKQNRRVFMMQLVGGVGALALGSKSSFAAVEKLSESDSYAKSMGFKLKTEDVDKAKWKRWTAEQKCGSCQLWNGRENKAVAGYGECSFFERYTPETGWCKNYKPQGAAA